MKRGAPPERPTRAQDASPQVGRGHGHTEVSNELLEAFVRFPFTGPQARIIFFVLRDSYGWKRKETRAYSFTDLSATLDMPRGTIHRAFTELRDLGILDAGNDGGWVLIKNYNGWGKGPLLPLSIVPLAERSTHGTLERSTGETKASTGGTIRSASGTLIGEIKVKKKERGTDPQLLPNGKNDTPRNRAEIGHEEYAPEDHADFKRLSFKLQDELTETWKESREKARKATACKKGCGRPRAADEWAYCRPCTVCSDCGAIADGKRTFSLIKGEVICASCK